MGTELQWCGHPVACIVSKYEDTHYCGWCVDVDRAEHRGYHRAIGECQAAIELARAEERERCAALAESIGEPLMAGYSIADTIRGLDNKEEPECG